MRGSPRSMRGEGGWEPKRAPARLLVEWSTGSGGQADLGPGGYQLALWS